MRHGSFEESYGRFAPNETEVIWLKEFFSFCFMNPPETMLSYSCPPLGYITTQKHVIIVKCKSSDKSLSLTILIFTDHQHWIPSTLCMRLAFLHTHMHVCACICMRACVCDASSIWSLRSSHKKKGKKKKKSNIRATYFCSFILLNQCQNSKYI